MKMSKHNIVGLGMTKTSNYNTPQKRSRQRSQKANIWVGIIQMSLLVLYLLKKT